MLCTKCNSEAVENHALGNKFWYCRTCKEEISTKAGNMTLSEQEMDDIQKQVADCWRAMSNTGGL